MSTIEYKKNIVEKWLDKEGYYNVEIAHNNYFIKADGISTRMFITIEDDFELDVKKIKHFAFETNREAWIAKVKTETLIIEWEML